MPRRAVATDRDMYGETLFLTDQSKANNGGTDHNPPSVVKPDQGLALSKSFTRTIASLLPSQAASRGTVLRWPPRTPTYLREEQPHAIFQGIEKDAI